MNVLIVDDTHQKVENVCEVLKSLDQAVQIVHETNVASARRRLRTEKFDLLLIDLKLPSNAGAAPTERGGLEFFDLLLLDNKSCFPGEVLFVTSEDGLFAAMRNEVLSRGCSICEVSDRVVDWRTHLSGKASLALKRSSRINPRVDVAVVTALGSELDAVLQLDYGWADFRIAEDPTLYHSGRIHLQNGESRSIVAASALRKGMAASAAIATKLVLNFEPSMLAMTGICAGVRGKANIGDVVVGSPTWDWGSGKHAEADDGLNVFRLAPKQANLGVGIENMCDEISRCATFAARVRDGWRLDLPPGKFGCHIGPMASGASVIANESVALEIANQNRDLIAIEMEAFAVMVATEYSTVRPTIGIAIKSVCDYADSQKHDGWQSYAAYTSATFADELFKRFFVAQ
jgi:nucleoside phosphorylase/CheY-like chemotaxis protein